MTELPAVDFAAHPAYAQLARAGNELDSEVDSLVNEIDGHYSRIGTVLYDDDEGRWREYDREISPRIDSLIEVTLRSPHLRPAFARHFKSAMQSARRRLRTNLSAVVQPRNSDMAKLTAQVADDLCLFRRDGFYKAVPDANLATRVWTKTFLERAVMRRMARKNPRRHCVIPLDPMSAGAKALQEAVVRGGILDLASAYAGMPMAYLYAALDHAHPSQDWYKGCYAAEGLPTSKTVYMHLDADSGIMKALFYLKDVGPGDGPFSFVRGSHLWKRSPLTVAVQKGMDDAQSDAFELQPDGLDYKSGYYRPFYKLREHRADILSLPSRLRGSTHFGDDIVDGSALSNELLSHEEVFTGPAGTLVMFDGSRGIHRGSLAEKGERWAIQLAFRAIRDDDPPARLATPLRRLKRRILYGQQVLRTALRLVTG
jgi:hypothetical protein